MLQENTNLKNPALEPGNESYENTSLSQKTRAKSQTILHVLHSSAEKSSTHPNSETQPRTREGVSFSAQEFS